jgi:pimeloyl-ACP methyl ester carboxylesterase
VPYATNRLDGARTYFEDDGGQGVAVVLHGGLLDSVVDVRESNLARALPTSEFRTIYVDHRGLGRSDKPHDPASYALPLRVADAVAVVDELVIARAHFIGMSWGGRLAFGIGEHAPDRVLSLVILGQQPYAWPDSPLTRVVTDGLAGSRTTSAGLVEALEAFWGVRFPAAQRARWLSNDAIALRAAWRAVLAEGAVAGDLTRWRVPCLICIGSADADFVEQARQAAGEIPAARFVELDAADHYEAHVSEGEALREAVLSSLRENSGKDSSRRDGLRRRSTRPASDSS